MGNIADMHADAIVTPTNKWLNEWQGSSKSIFEKAGRQQLRKECSILTKQYGPFPITATVPTSGLNANADMIIHAVVPKWIDGQSNEYENLYITYLNCLETADQSCCESIAFPLLAAGNNGFDIDLALEIAITSINSYQALSGLKTVYLVLYNEKIAKKIMRQGMPVKLVNKHYIPKQKMLVPKMNFKGAFQIAQKVCKEGIQFYIDNPDVVHMIVNNIRILLNQKEKA